MGVGRGRLEVRARASSLCGQWELFTELNKMVGQFVESWDSLSHECREHLGRAGRGRIHVEFLAIVQVNGAVE